MNSNFDYTVVDMINNAIRTVKAAPLVLGATSSGGGGPVGGYVDYLVQNRVSFDTVENAAWAIPVSGISLVTNLDRIRYRLNILESGTFLDLDDTPNTYSGSAGKAVIVNPTETGLIFGASLPTLSGSKVVITDSSGNITTDGQLNYDNTGNTLVVGNAPPAISNNSITINSDGTIAPALFIWGYGSGFRPFTTYFFANGTQTSPTAVTSGQTTAAFGRSRPHDGVDFENTQAEIRAVANQNHNATDHGMRLEIYTTPNGSTTLTKVATFTNDGNIDLASGKEYRVNGAQHTHLATDIESNVVRNTAQFDKTDSTLADITDLTRNVLAGVTYRFKAYLFTASDIASGISFAVSGTATATAIRYESLLFQNGVMIVPGTTRATALDTKVGDVTAVTVATCVIEGMITVNATGALTVQFATNTGTNTASILTGSYFEVVEVSN